MGPGSTTMGATLPAALPARAPALTGLLAPTRRGALDAEDDETVMVIGPTMPVRSLLACVALSRAWRDT